MTKLLVCLMSTLAGAVAFIYSPMLMPTILAEGALKLSPLIFSYVAAVVTFFVSSLCLGISYEPALEEKIKKLFSESLKIENLEATELEFLILVKDLGKGNVFLKAFENLLLTIKKKPKDIQIKAIINFVEARTLELLAGLSLSDSDKNITEIRKALNSLKSLAAKIGGNVGAGVDGAEKNKSEALAELMLKIEILVNDAPKRRLKP